MTIQAQLRAQPGHPNRSAVPGRHALNLGSSRDSFYYVPRGYNSARPAPLALMLHGAGGHAGHGLALLQDHADVCGLVIVAPASVSSTWDMIAGPDFGVDVALVDKALQQVFEHCVVDTTRLAIGGFSDGASYALSLGIANGELFTHVIAFSPGFIAPVTPRGQPHVYVSHGTGDTVLPIHACSRRIVQRLERAEYDVQYHEFNGAHVVPPEIAREAMIWFLGK